MVSAPQENGPLKRDPFLLEDHPPNTAGHQHPRPHPYNSQRSVVERLIREHGEGHEDHSPKLWDLLVLELWEQMFIDGEEINGQAPEFAGVASSVTVS